MITYNHRPYIAQALDSILAQHRKFSIEIVISDDCSPDGTAREIDRYQVMHSDLFVRLDPRANLGMHKNLDRVWTACRGRYIAMLEGDDFWHDPRKLETQVAFMESHPQCALCGHHARVITSEGDGFREVETYPLQNQPELSDITRLIRINFMHTCSVMYRAGLVSEIPAWISGLPIGDWPLSLVHALLGPIGFINRSLSTHRYHLGGAFSPTTPAQRNDITMSVMLAMHSVFPRHLSGHFSRMLAQCYRGLARQHYEGFLNSRAESDLRAAQVHLWQSIANYFVSFRFALCANIKLRHLPRVI